MLHFRTLPKWVTRPELYISLCTLIVLAYFFTNFFLTPKIWPDEDLFAAPALSLAQGKSFGSPWLASVLEGADVRTYWMPPGYFFYLASFIYFFGAKLAVIRFSSIVLFLMIIWVFNIFLGRLGVSKNRRMWASVLLMTDVVILRAALIGRMELLVLVLALASACLALATSHTNTKLTKFLISTSSGVVAGAAFLTHPIGIFSACFSFLLLSMMVNSLLFFVAGFVLILAPYALYVSLDWPLFVGQFGAQLARKSEHAAISWYEILSKYVHLWDQYGTSSRLALVFQFTSIFGLAVVCRRHPKYLPIFFAQIAILVSIMLSGEMWYTVYAVPLAIASISLFQVKRPALRTLLIVMICAFCVRNIGQILSRIRSAEGTAVSQLESWHVFGEKIKTELPVGGEFLISISSPSPFLAIWNDDLRNYHLNFPTKIPHERLADFYGKLDGIVIGGEGPMHPRDELFLGQTLGPERLVVSGPFKARIRLVNRQL